MTLKYRPEIDGLRCVAVLPVILFHAGFSIFSGGYVGVDIFFVISGYLIATIILRRMADRKFSLLEFYEARARRILPALFVVMLVCIPLGWRFMDPSQWEEFSQSLVWTSLFGSNFFFWMNSDYFASASEMKPLLHTWSLAVEEQFYLVFPLLVMLLWRSRRLLQALLILIGVASFLYCCWMANRNPQANFFLTPFRVWELLAGVACAYLLLNGKSKWPDGIHKLAEPLSLLGLGMIGYSVFFFTDKTPFPSVWALLPILGTVLLALFSDRSKITKAILSAEPVVFIGLISYSAYLWHQPVFAFARIRAMGDLDPSVTLLMIVLSLVLAAVSWRWVEQPFRKKKTSGRVLGGAKMLQSRPLLLSSALVGIVGFSIAGMVLSSGAFQPIRFQYTKSIQADFNQNAKQRGELIHYGTCHFNPPASWKGAWDCKSGAGQDSELKPTGIAIFGDSHAADKAMILRRMGYSPTQFGGTGCSLLPAKSDPHCAELAQFARGKIQEDPSISEIWLSNQFDAQESLPANMEAMLEYWSESGKQIVVFGQMPVYPFLKEKIYFSAPIDPKIKTDFSRYDRFARAENLELFEKYNVIYVDMTRIICARKDRCSFRDGKGLLYLDDTHLTPRGADVAANRLKSFFDCTASPKGTFGFLAIPGRCKTNRQAQ